MNRRSFLGLVKNIAMVAAAIGVPKPAIAFIESRLYDTVFVDASSGPVTITLPPASTGTYFIIRRIAGANPITIIGPDHETVER
jgi:hypothetical protein